ncbi:MAG: hypothetical protein CMP33_06885 [Rickettsiales bacterium]|nr:hypothetical protein [Rickettsiales bacterium]
MITKGTFLIIYIIISRIFELILSYKNTNRLMKIGGIEYYSFHYKFLISFHIFFVSYFLVMSFNTYVFDENLLLIFILIQFLRYKIIYDLGKFWTTKIIVLKDVPLVKSGVYKFLRHPNYIIVFVEVFLVCLIFFDYQALIFFTLSNLVLLLVRIHYEDKANRTRRDNS